MPRHLMPLALLLSAIYPYAANDATLVGAASAGLLTPQAAEGSFQIDDRFITGLTSPTSMVFAPDGRLFVTEQAGVVRIISSAGQLLSTPFLTLVGVRSDGERGLLGLAFDPQFTANGYVYIFYTPSSPAVTRVSRVTATGDRVLPSSEVTLLEYANVSGNHRGGDLHFGRDGKLYIALGDAGNPTNAQLATSFDGKILRINRDGSIPSDNPTLFTTTSGPTVAPAGAFRAIWAIGLRNPYRFTFDANTGAMRINDVGAGGWEEVNVGRAGGNYGWPTCEGPCANSYTDNPIYVHERGIEGCAITGGVFYTGSQFPAAYHNNYFLIDYCSTWLRHLRPDNSETTFPILIPQYSVDLKVAPDGSLYVLGHGSGVVSRITYAPNGSNRNPTADATASPTSGTPPLTVTFSATGSNDPDGDPLVFSWDFGDGGTGAGINTSHTYSTSGAFAATVTVSDGKGGSHSKAISIAVGTPPVAAINLPANGTQYSAGETIQFSGTATDAEDGALPPSAFNWTVLFHHDSHTHPEVGPISGATTGAFSAPTIGHTEDTVFYRIYLTVTDSSGLQTRVTRDVSPRKAMITLSSNIGGAQILLDGQPRSTPHTFVGVVGVLRTIEVVSPQTANGQGYEFSSWSDGGAIRHTISTPATATTYTATLAPQSVQPLPLPVMYWKFDNSLTESIAATPTSGSGTLQYSAERAPVSQNTGSLTLDGAPGTYVAVAGDRVFNGWTAATTSMWIKISGATAASWANNTYHALLFKYRILQTRILKDGAGQLRLVAAHSDGTLFGTPVVSSTTIPVDTWVNLLTVHEGSTLQTFINGASANIGDTGRTFGAASTERLEIVGYGGNFAGAIDDFRIYDRALSRSEVTALVGMTSAPSPPTGVRIIR